PRRRARRPLAPPAHPPRGRAEPRARGARGRDALLSSHKLARNLMPVPRGAGRTVEVRAPAKLNLFLEVVGRRADGFHDIESVLQQIDLADDLTVTLASRSAARIDLRVEGDGAPPGPGNTVYKAADLFLQRFAPSARISAVLRKRVPSEAGLGG